MNRVLFKISGWICVQAITYKKIYFLVLCGVIYTGSLHANPMQQFIEAYVPLGENGKIAIPAHIKHIKLDIGLSYSAPQSQQWLSHEEDLWVFGFEPHLGSVDSIRKGAVKKLPGHGEPLDIKYIDTQFFLIPCALGNLSGAYVDFYITENDCGCSSLYRPLTLNFQEVTRVPVFRLSDFFDLFPFDTHPVIEYIKTDAQGSDLDIIKNAGHYLQDRVVYITIELEDTEYENTNNSGSECIDYMNSIGFIQTYGHPTEDPTFLNTRFIDYIQKNNVKIFQKG